MKYFDYPHSYPLELGGELPGFRLAYHSYGDRAKAKRIVWVCHALTANSDAQDWWPGLVGSGCYFDPAEDYILCANILGSCYGSTGPLSLDPRSGQPYYGRFPVLTVRDMVGALELLRQALDLPKIDLLIGGSLGGQQAMEWAIRCPERFERLVLLATNARHSPWGIAFNESQRLAIEADATWGEDSPQAGQAGMKAARSLALLSYRNYGTYAQAQSEPDHAWRQPFKAASYQAYQGEKLVKRFNAYSYYRLSQAMDSHNVGRGRESLEAALGQIQAKTLVISIAEDLLFPASEQAFLARYIPAAIHVELPSKYGHDGFLLEVQGISACLRAFA